MCSCHCILGCCVKFSGVEYKIVCFITFMDEHGFALVKGGTQSTKQKAEGSP